MSMSSTLATLVGLATGVRSTGLPASAFMTRSRGFIVSVRGIELLLSYGHSRLDCDNFARSDAREREQDARHKRNQVRYAGGRGRHHDDWDICFGQSLLISQILVCGYEYIETAPRQRQQLAIFLARPSHLRHRGDIVPLKR